MTDRRFIIALVVESALVIAYYAGLFIVRSTPSVALHLSDARLILNFGVPAAIVLVTNLLFGAWTAKSPSIVKLLAAINIALIPLLTLVCAAAIGCLLFLMCI